LNNFFDSHGVPFAGNNGEILPLWKRIIPAIDVFLFNRAAQQNMHLTSGIRRGFRGGFWLRVSSALKHFTSPPTGR